METTIGFEAWASGAPAEVSTGMILFEYVRIMIRIHPSFRIWVLGSAFRVTPRLKTVGLDVELKAGMAGVTMWWLQAQGLLCGFRGLGHDSQNIKSQNQGLGFRV